MGRDISDYIVRW